MKLVLKHAMLVNYCCFSRAEHQANPERKGVPSYSCSFRIVLCVFKIMIKCWLEEHVVLGSNVGLILAIKEIYRYTLTHKQSLLDKMKCKVYCDELLINLKLTCQFSVEKGTPTDITNISF